MPPKFEWDPIKSAANWWKHDITLADACDLWLDPDRVYIRANSTPTETRYGFLARHQEKVWFVTFTTRGGVFRLISCRRARKKEIEVYRRGRI